MSGAFLSSDNRPDAREREREKNLAEYHAQVAQTSYRWATAVMVAGMVVIAMPRLGLAAWNWYIGGGVALVVTALAIRMMIHGRVGNGLASLVCAFVILPGWVYMAADVVTAGHEFYEIVVKQWKDKLG